MKFKKFRKSVTLVFSWNIRFLLFRQIKMAIQFDKYNFDIQPLAFPLKEISLKNYSTKPAPKERRGRRKAHPTPEPLYNITPYIPLELDATSYATYQDALAAAIEILLESEDADDPTIDNLIIEFSNLSYFDLGSQSFKPPGPVSFSHIEFIFENSEYFSTRYEIRENRIYRKESC